MRYNFDEIVPRTGTDSYKWDSAVDTDILPMWVANMDFHTAPVIIKTLRQRVEHGIFGHTRVPDAHYEAVTGWFEHQHRWQIRKEWMICTSGVVPAISVVIKALAEPGNKVLIQAPVYNCFFSSIRNSGCEIIHTPLSYARDTFTIDYKDLEKKAADPKVEVMLLYNPHNPTGGVWAREELNRIDKIYVRNGLMVISDEIHRKLVFPGYTFAPFASTSEEFLRHSVTCLSSSKAFNIAGLQITNIVCCDENLCREIDRAININEVCDVNPFGVIATIATYNEGEEWLSQLVDYLWQDYLYMENFCGKYLPDFPITLLKGTYLVWIDCRKLGKSSEELEHLLIKKAELWLNAGTMYGAEGGGFMRWNIACPRSLLIKKMELFRGFVGCAC